MDLNKFLFQFYVYSNKVSCIIFLGMSNTWIPKQCIGFKVFLSNYLIFLSILWWPIMITYLKNSFLVSFGYFYQWNFVFILNFTLKYKLCWCDLFYSQELNQNKIHKNIEKLSRLLLSDNTRSDRNDQEVNRWQPMIFYLHFINSLLDCVFKNICKSIIFQCKQIRMLWKVMFLSVLE